MIWLLPTRFWQLIFETSFHVSQTDVVFIQVYSIQLHYFVDTNTLSHTQTHAHTLNSINSIFLKKFHSNINVWIDWRLSTVLVYKTPVRNDQFDNEQNVQHLRFNSSSIFHKHIAIFISFFVLSQTHFSIDNEPIIKIRQRIIVVSFIRFSFKNGKNSVWKSDELIVKDLVLEQKVSLLRMSLDRVFVYICVNENRAVEFASRWVDDTCQHTHEEYTEKKWHERRNEFRSFISVHVLSIWPLAIIYFWLNNSRGTCNAHSEWLTAIQIDVNVWMIFVKQLLYYAQYFANNYMYIAHWTDVCVCVCCVWTCNTVCHDSNIIHISMEKFIEWHQYQYINGFANSTHT